MVKLHRSKVQIQSKGPIMIVPVFKYQQTIIEKVSCEIFSDCRDAADDVEFFWWRRNWSLTELIRDPLIY